MENDSPSAAAMGLDDVYYALFRHKWKIVLCALAGVLAAAAAVKVRPPPYQSEAKLFIRYVITETNREGPGTDDAVRKSPDQRGETIISSEQEILTSLDLAQEVVNAVGAERVLAKPGLTDPNKAAVAIKRALLVDVPPRSSVIQVEYRHRDPDVAQQVLRELIDRYLKKHLEIHRAIGMIDRDLTAETDQLRAQLAQTEEELRKVTNRAGIISLEDYKKSTGEQLARLRQQILDVQSQLAEQSSVYREMTHGGVPATTSATAAPATPPPADQVDTYRKILSRLALLHQREDEVLTQFTEESPRVLEIRGQIADAENAKKKIEEEFPGLLQLRNPPAANATRQTETQFDPAMEAARITALEARLKTLNGQMEDLKTEAGKVDQLETTILDLRRKKELEEANYRYYSTMLEQSRINESLRSGRVSNISIIETPTPPVRDWKLTLKLAAGLLAAGCLGGLGWAFAIEFYFDRSVRRPAQIEHALRLPLFLSIPQVTTKALAKSATLALPAPEAPADAGSPVSVNSTLARSNLVRQQRDVFLNPFHATLRDRLISYFDSLNVRHKPKLVGVTGLGRGTGVTTIAAGLARSFSETGEGNVLLVDMTQGQGSAQHFYKGTPVGLDELFDTRNSALVQDNLYVVTESSSSDRLAKGMPQRFNQLIPKLKASDFDYIIFDMPPVNQISITPRLASFMDMMLMVLESEKTDSDLATKASELLAKSKCPVGVVLNKTNTYIPAALHQDREFLLGS